MSHRAPVLHLPDPRYFRGGSDTLPPPGQAADTACYKYDDRIAEDPDWKNLCPYCVKYIQRRRQYYNFLRVRWATKKAGG